MAFNEYNYQTAKTRPLYLKSPWWIGHIPFAFELIKRLRPQTIVELGTYSGSSFAAFCQAVKSEGLDTKCYGIDLWKGDIHMGAYDEDIFKGISGYLKTHYPEISILMRSSFDEAVSRFDDSSIDLLHIDGTHTYEAVSNDFNTWFPKVSDRGVVLFHDTNATYETVGIAARDFGVKDFFDSIKGRFPNMEFKHCYGLGVLFVGRQMNDAVKELMDDATYPEFYAFFNGLGQDVSREFERISSEDEGNVTDRPRHPLKQRLLCLLGRVYRFFNI